MFAGGIADKLGNRYEAKWLVRQFLEVLSGSSHWIKFEGILTEFKGFEFAVGKGEVTEWHQTKISNANGNWTISALAREGVLDAFKARLSANERDKCIFVSQDPAKSVSVLAAKARVATKVDEFAASLGKGHRDDFSDLVDAWAAPPEQCYLWLQRSEIHTLPQAQIEALTNAVADRFFYNATSAFEILRDYLEERFNVLITTEEARAGLRREQKLRFKDLSFDPTVKEHLQECTDTYLGTYLPFGAGGHTIHRKQISEIVSKLLPDDGPLVVMVTGIAGSGKSGVVRGVIEELKRSNVVHLAFRVDQHLDCTTRASLGKSITDRSESPASTLKGIEPNSRTILVVDQLDAVSEISGRNGAVRQAILQLVDDAKAFRTVRLVLVCRSFDIENDSRLKALKSAAEVYHVDVPLLDWTEEVKPLLESEQISADGFSEQQKEILRLPLNLTIFLEAKGEHTFTSRTDLFNRLITYKDNHIRRDRELPWSLMAPLSAMAKWMSENQKLDVPKDVVAGFGGALTILSSEGLIVPSRERINFFHESFFDHVYARSFYAEATSLTEVLTSTEQHLFRRTQARQILEVLRQEDWNRYLREVRTLLSEDRVRFHIKFAILRWLGSLSDPSKEEAIMVLRSVDDGVEPLPSSARNALFGSPGWFDRLNEAGWIERNVSVNDSPRRRQIFFWLAGIAADRSKEIVGLLENWWAGDSERARILFEWFGYVRRKSADRPLIEFCARLIEQHPASLFDEEGANHRAMLLSTWAGEQASLGDRVLGAYFSAWFKVHTNGFPFEREHLNDMDHHALEQMAKDAPGAFVRGTIEALKKSIVVVQSRINGGEYDYSFKRRHFSGYHFGEEKFLALFRSSLVAVAVQSPEQAKAFLAELDPRSHEVIAHIHLETIAANPEALAENFMDVLNSGHAFQAGWEGAEWKSFADAAKVVLPFLSNEERRSIEVSILAHAPERDFAITVANDARWSDRRHLAVNYLNRAGWEQLSILNSIGETLLSPSTQMRLHELRRKFPGQRLPAPRHNEAQWVGSPIERESAEKMGDDQWLGAMIRYATDERRFEENTIAGGARQLASELQRQTKDDPDRFARLAKRIPLDANECYLGAILSGLAETESASIPLVIDVVLLAHARHGRPYGSEISRLVGAHPSAARDGRILDTVFWYLQNGDPDSGEEVISGEDQHSRVTIEMLLERSSRLYFKGSSSARGWAAEALARVLWESLDSADRAWEVLEERIRNETQLTIRSCLMQPLVPLFNHNRERCAENYRRLCGLDRNASAELLPLVQRSLVFPSQRLPRFLQRALVRLFFVSMAIGRRSSRPDLMLSPMVSFEGARLFPYVFRTMPKIGQNLLCRVLRSGDDTWEKIAAWHIFRKSFQDALYGPAADELLAKSAVHRRLAADVASKAVAEQEYRHRAISQLCHFFNDDDGEVRAEASEAFRSIDPNDFEQFYSLAKTYLESRAFESESAFAFLQSLEEAATGVSDLVIRAAERLISDATRDGAQAGHRHIDLHQLQDLLKREYTASDGNGIQRAKILDVIDLMLFHDMYGVDEIIKAHER